MTRLLISILYLVLPTLSFVKLQLCFMTCVRQYGSIFLTVYRVTDIKTANLNETELKI